MAYAALVSLTQTIEKIIQNHDEYSISLHQKQQILSLDKYAIILQKFLEDFPDKAKANGLEGRIRDVTNEAENIIEFYMWEKTHSRLRSDKWRSLPTKFADLKLKHQLKRIKKEMDSITEEVTAMKNNSAAVKDDVAQLGDSADADSSSSRLAPVDDTVGFGDSAAASSSSRFAPVDDMVGLHDDLIAIKSRLCGGTTKLQIIPIVGMGGIGKTTLARNAYDDPLSDHYFDLRAWVTVSQDYSQEEMLSSLLVSLKLPNKEIPKRIELVKEKVYKSLKGRRYLIVMDDMWSGEAWDDVRNIFPDDGNGSRIMLTTRLFDMAAYPDSSTPSHEIRLMDANQSWDLLRTKVFKNEYCPPTLEKIGKKIARSCRGLPLAIVVISGLLSTDTSDPSWWSEIAENVSSAIAGEDEQFEKILSLSYTHLPHHLRPCFLSMAGFREDSEMHVSFIVKLWVAEGFLKSQSRSLEDVAEECLEELVQRSLVMISKRKSNGRIKSCRLHDLMRDLCIRKSRDEMFLANPLKIIPSTTSKIVYHRRISAHSTYYSHLPKSYAATIHTIMYFHLYFSHLGFQSFRLLRVLIVGEAYDMPMTTYQLFELYHLRHLAMVCSNRIPAAIAKLQNLQTLIILERRKEPRFVEILPPEIWKMPQLRHVVHCGSLPDPDGGATFTTLEKLQTLSSLACFRCTKRTMEMIPNVKKLTINCYEQLGTFLNNLIHLHQLENLKLQAAPNYRVSQIEDDFSLPANLRKLTLSRLHLPWNKMTMVGSLPNLQVLKLRHSACDGKTWETSEGGFPLLEYLLIEESNLEQLLTESSHFPRLKSLLLYHCRRLSEVPDDIGEIPTLELIEVKGLKQESLVESARRIQEEQKSYGNDTLQVNYSSFWWK